MTSKEALREIVTATLKYLPNAAIDKISDLSNIVLQDLEILEFFKDIIVENYNEIEMNCLEWDKLDSILAAFGHDINLLKEDKY